MDFKHRNAKTSSLSELLENSIFSKNMKNKTFGQTMKHSTIFSFWKDVVGAKFANFTKPMSVKGTKLFVSAKSPVIVQELSLYKTKLLNKINSYSKPLGIEITDIIFSYKNYAVSNPIQNNSTNDMPYEIKKEEIEKVEVDNGVKNEIQDKINRIKFLNATQKDALVAKIISAHKAKMLRDEKQDDIE